LICGDFIFGAANSKTLSSAKFCASFPLVVDEAAGGSGSPRALGGPAVQRSMVLSALEGGTAAGMTCRRIGGPLLFERLWYESGCRAVLESLLAGRRFEFAVERIG
jgi:hypothetical protein